MEELVKELRLKPNGIKKSDVCTALDFVLSYLHRVEDNNKGTDVARKAKKAKDKLYDLVCELGSFDEVVKEVDED